MSPDDVLGAQGHACIICVMRAYSTEPYCTGEMEPHCPLTPSLNK